ncbi:hypothetical protein EMWEY_00059960 [Eimeria maxima]|uniref:Uncharacterized protein n=1 Tax=Eimeria maxima TaxID=5804 RepID=U6MEN0_EIMMA|nr:hypothetical protein EMWEY_00059960 [Eimeria maxima]CDJ60105.1 hypothetical protein EMWEY_00059960 [Eimeria maxima]
MDGYCGRPRQNMYDMANMYDMGLTDWIDIKVYKSLVTPTRLTVLTIWMRWIEVGRGATCMGDMALAIVVSWDEVSHCWAIPLLKVFKSLVSTSVQLMESRDVDMDCGWARPDMSG